MCAKRDGDTHLDVCQSKQACKANVRAGTLTLLTARGTDTILFAIDKQSNAGSTSPQSTPSSASASQPIYNLILVEPAPTTHTCYATTVEKIHDDDDDVFILEAQNVHLAVSWPITVLSNSDDEDIVETEANSNVGKAHSDVDEEPEDPEVELCELFVFKDMAGRQRVGLS